jgi:hypothetical protein
VKNNLEFCACDPKSWPGTKLCKGLLMHGTCGKPLLCLCGIVAVNIGLKGAECMNCSPISSDTFFDEAFDLERGFFDSFIYYAGGLRVTDMLDGSPDFSNADYFFEEARVVVELKILKTEFSSTPTHLQKFERLVEECLADGRLDREMCLGVKPLPEHFVREHMFIIREQLEGITKKANKQIKDTKVKLKLTDSQGLLLVLNDGFYAANPNLTLALIGDPLTRQMRSIDGYVLFNLRRKLRRPGDQWERFFWLPKYRSADNFSLSEFVNSLGANWFRYLEELSGKTFPSKVSSFDPDFKELNDGTYS